MHSGGFELTRLAYRLIPGSMIVTWYAIRVTHLSY